MLVPIVKVVRIDVYIQHTTLKYSTTGVWYRYLNSIEINVSKLSKLIGICSDLNTR